MGSIIRVFPRRAAEWTMLLFATAVILAGSTALAQAKSLDELVAAVVRVKTYIGPDARTVDKLGRELEGSGIVIDDSLVLAIGYLMVEARTAEIGTSDGRTVPVGYGHETGFVLLRAIVPLKTKPLPLGKSADVRDKDPVLVASFGGPQMVAPAHVALKREFAGSWEYLLDEAIFTVPPHPAWSGAALINRDGRLVGVGSLVVGEIGPNHKVPGNMFVPIDLLPSILADLISSGRVSTPRRPWLGVTTSELNGEVIITRITLGSPAERAGVQPGEIIVGVNGHRPKSLSDFYRKVWASGPAGSIVPLSLLRNSEVR